MVSPEVSQPEMQSLLRYNCIREPIPTLLIGNLPEEFFPWQRIPSIPAPPHPLRIKGRNSYRDEGRLLDLEIRFRDNLRFSFGVWKKDRKEIEKQCHASGN
ncbi:hypothetical protein TNCV_675051 [Trichonephila clavipes]|nr:hypothetical protein TNCV_675051 [Trichonephila clavipes]